MFLFWTLAFVMVVIGLAFILPPLLGRDKKTNLAHDELNIVIYKQRLAELESDSNYETLTEEQRKMAREELEKSLLQDLDETQNQESNGQAPNSRLTLITVVSLVVAVPLIAFGIYALKSPEELQQHVEASPTSTTKPPSESTRAQASNQQQGQATQGTQQSSNMPSVAELIPRLKERLESEPNDAQGWSLLGRSYARMKQHDEAVKAYAKAHALLGDDHDLMVNYAESLSMTGNQEQHKQATALVDKVLALKPTHPKGLWLGGALAFQIGKHAQAIKHWETLLSMHQDSNGEGAQKLKGFIQQAKAQLGGSVASTTTTPTIKPTKTPLSNVTSAIKVNVSIDAKMKSKVSPNDTVFIFARAAKGPRMPLAIVRKKVKDLPVEIKLDDSMAMMSNMKLSNFKDIYVGARISKSGNAIPQKGDIQGGSPVPNFSTLKKPVKVVINEEVGK